MKKLIIALILITALTGCSKEDNSISFNQKNYEFSHQTDKGYDVYTNDNHELEIIINEDGFVLSTEIDEDIYIVAGTTAKYQITKNGSTITFSGTDQETTGTESVDWNDDIIPIIEKLTK